MRKIAFCLVVFGGADIARATAFEDMNSGFKLSYAGH